MKRILFVALLFLFSKPVAGSDCSNYDPEVITYSSHYIVCHSRAIYQEYSSTKRELLLLLDSYMERHDLLHQEKDELIALKNSIDSLDGLGERYAQEECYISLYGNRGMESFNDTFCILAHKNHITFLMKNILKYCKKNPPGGADRMCDAF